MSKIHFQLGGKHFVEVNLPSKKPGDGDVFVGKVKAQASSLRCSQKVSFHRRDLVALFDQVAVVEKKLEGSFKLESISTTFCIVGNVDSKGLIQIKVRFKDYVFDQPENVEWQAQATFTVWPEHLKRIISQRVNLV